MLAVVNIQSIKVELNLVLANSSYDFVIGRAYGYKLSNPFIGYMYMDAIDGIKYLTTSEIQNLVKNIKKFIHANS